MGYEGGQYFQPIQSSPDTGITRQYQFTLSRVQIAPDDYPKDVVLVNGQFPGLIIEANWGDWIEVQVTNSIYGPEEGTSLHWRGLLQIATPWYDVTPSVQQCPVVPGAAFTYHFRAELYGTSWYHSHYSAQYTGGLLGPMVIYGPSNYDYDIDLGPVLISDCKYHGVFGQVRSAKIRSDFHKDYFDIVEEIESTDQTKWLQHSDNNLINGKMNFNCSSVGSGRPCTENAPLAEFKFQKGKAHRLRLINAGAAGQQFFSINKHEIIIIAYDLVPIKPFVTKTVFLGAGQRTDVVVQANGDENRAYWMRSNISTICNLEALRVTFSTI